VDGPEITTRRASVDDVDTVLAIARPGFESYAEFAPPGWRPPAGRDERQRAADLLADPQTWALLALADERPVGHFAFTPARERSAGEPPPAAWRERPVIVGLAHLWQLFVLPDWSGRGIAPLLHEAGTVAMRARGYERARLFTPSGQARARRFYERRGWLAGDERFNPEIGLRLVEYRLELGSRPSGSAVRASAG
jgi:GNAT superfamily N-acetyltransferase